MRHIDFDPTQLTADQKLWWNRWIKRADKSLKKAIAAWENGEKPSFDDKVWKDLRTWLIEDVFKGKCAYCETQISRFTPDAEHFRPKAAVQVRRDGKLETINHPGYFWLAYHWKNLLPSCEFCNRSGGKGNQFPVEKTHIVPKTVDELDSLQPDDLDFQENPLLLNPYSDDPQKYIRFGLGEAYAVDGNEKGKQSIDIYRLNQDELLSERITAQKNAWKLYLLALTNDGTEISIASKKALEQYKNRESEYSAAVLDYIHMQFKRLNIPKEWSDW